MFLHYRHFIVIACSHFDVDQEMTIDKNDSGAISEYDFDLTEGLNILANLYNPSSSFYISGNQIEIVGNTEYVNPCTPNFSNTFQEQLSNTLHQSHNPSDENSMINKPGENIYTNTQERYNVSLPTFSTHQPLKHAVFQLPVNSNKAINKVDNNTERIGASAFYSTEHTDNSVLLSNEKHNEIGKRMLQNEENNCSCEKRRKISNSDFNYSGDENNLCASNIINTTGILNCSDKASVKESGSLNVNQQSALIKEFNKKFKKEISYLNTLKSYKAAFKNSKIHDKSVFTSISSSLEELTELVVSIKKLCNGFIEEKFSTTDFINNINDFEKLDRLASDVRNIVFCLARFVKSIRNTNFSTLRLSKINAKFESRIQENKFLLNQLKQNDIFKNLENESSEDVSNECKYVAAREYKFIYQDKNSLNLQIFNISTKVGFTPSSFCIFKESVFLVVYSPSQYLSILKIDLKNKNQQEIKNYMIKKGKKCKKDKSFGLGSKYTIIRSGSEGKLLLLKSPLRIKNKKISFTREYFEILVVDYKFNVLACEKIDTFTTKIGSVRPTIVDFVCHNDLVYALDMKCRCLKILNESLVLLKTIPIPECLIEIEDSLLAVSSKYILIGHINTLYYIEINDQNTKFKWLKLPDTILNIAFYDEEIIVGRFTNGCYSFKIEEKSSDIKYTHFT